MKPLHLQGHYAGFLSRALGVVIDYWVVAALLAGVVAVTAWLFNVFGVDLRSCQPALSGAGARGLACTGGRLALLFVVLTIAPLYYSLLWALVGQTVGQRVMGLRVLRLDGSGISFGRGLLRFIGYQVCVFTLGLGFLWVLVDERRMGWHDKLARTCVIYDWKAKQNEGMIARVRGRFARNRQDTAPSPKIAS